MEHLTKVNIPRLGICDVRHPVDDAVAARAPARHRHAQEGGRRQVLERGRPARGPARAPGRRHLR